MSNRENLRRIAALSLVIAFGMMSALEVSADSSEIVSSDESVDNGAVSSEEAFDIVIDAQVNVPTNDLDALAVDDIVEETMYSSASDEFVIKDGTLTKYNGTSANVTIPSGVSKIGNGAFKNNKKIQSVTIPNSVKSIGQDAFKDCTNLSSVSLGNGLIEMGSYAFSSCGVTSITIPGSLKAIPSSAFKNCTFLKNVIISEGVAKINDGGSQSDGAFYGCTSLKSVSVPSTMSIIGSRAFFRCTALNNITVPLSVDTIGNDVFYKCNKVLVYRNSPAHLYCKANSSKQGFTYKVIDSSDPVQPPIAEPTPTPMNPSTVSVTWGHGDELVEGCVVHFFVHSNSSSATLYIDAFNDKTGERYNAVTKEMTRANAGTGFDFVADNKFTTAGRKIFWVVTADGVKSDETEIYIAAANKKLSTPVYKGVTNITVGEKAIISWSAVENATGYTVWLRSVDSINNAIDLSNLVVGHQVIYEFTKSGHYYLQIYAVGAAGYGTSEPCNVLITAREPLTPTPAVRPTTTPKPTSAPTSAPTAKPTDSSVKKMQVSSNGKRLNVRSMASKSGSIIAKLKDGDKVGVISTKNGWSRIRAAVNGTVIEGYVSAEYLKSTGEPAPTSAATDKPTSAPGTTVNARVATKGSKLKLRAAASSSASVIARMPNGSSLKVLETVNGWCRVQFTAANGTVHEGWASSQYITVIA